MMIAGKSSFCKFRSVNLSLGKLIKAWKGFHKPAFTLAEVLIVLGIIGVVAALTIPTLVKNYEKKVTLTKLRKAYSIISQAVLKSYQENGPVTEYITPNTAIDSNKTKKFFDTYWLPYFKSPSVSANGAFPYGIDSPFFVPSGNSRRQMPVWTRYADGKLYYTTADGIAYAAFIGDSGGIYFSSMSIFVDLNGTTKPNRLGRDVFVFYANYSDNSVVPACKNSTDEVVNQRCSRSGDGMCCSGKIIRDGWQIKSNYPW